jgi:hypothetical protein
VELPVSCVGFPGWLKVYNSSLIYMASHLICSSTAIFLVNSLLIHSSTSLGQLNFVKFLLDSLWIYFHIICIWYCTRWFESRTRSIFLITRWSDHIHTNTMVQIFSSAVMWWMWANKPNCGCSITTYFR